MSNVHDVLAEVCRERDRQDAKWGEQNHPNGTGDPLDVSMANQAKANCVRAFTDGAGTWQYILDEEVCEAFAEHDPAALRRELVQVAAVAVAWVQAIDRAAAGASK